MKLRQIISEIQFSIYQAMVRIGHREDITVQDVGEMLRAFLAFKNTSIKRIPEVTKVEVAEKTIEKKK